MNTKFNSKHFISVFLLLCFLAFQLLPHVYAADLPEPSADFYVNDYADVLSSETEKHIIELNDSLYAQTGAQVVVVVRDFLDGMSIEDYGYNLFNQWEIGSSEKDNGVLLLLAIGEDDYRITLGKGTESILNMNFLTSVRDQYLEEPFSNGDYDEAVMKTVDAIAAKLAEHYKVKLSLGGQEFQAPQETQHDSQKLGDSSFLTTIIILILVISVFSGFFRSWTTPRRPRRSWMNPPPPPPPFHGWGGSMGPRPRSGGFFGGFGSPGSFGPHPPHSGNRKSGGGHSSGGGFSRGGHSGGGFSGGGRSGGGGSSRGGGIGRH